METQTKKLLKFLILPLIAVLVLIYTADWQLRPDYNLKISYYDVGQGDSIFIETYQGQQILLDGGPSSAVLQRLSEDLPFFDRSLDMIILSHPHADHVAGLIEVLKRYKVKKILLPEVEFDSDPYEEFLKLIEEKKIEKIYAREGMRVYLDNATVFDIYFPEAGERVADNDAKGLAGAKRNPNDVSIVGKLTFGKSKFLFTGDSGFDIENLILPKYNLDSDVLKVGHHGSRFSTSDELLKEVTPEYAVVSAGKNSYGHPTSDALDNLAEANAKILRTDQDHTVRFTSDGTEIHMIKK